MEGRALFAIVFLCACARTGLSGEPDPIASKVTCKPGDPPLVLTSNVVSRARLALATDGAWLYVVEPDRLWSVPTSGGDVTTLLMSSTYDPTAWNGGVYVDAPAAPGGAMWIRHDGLEQRRVFGGLFAPPLEIGFEKTDDNTISGGNFGGWTMWSQSIETGALAVAFRFPFWMELGPGLSGAYAHGVGRANTVWSDVRLDWADGARHDVVEIGHGGRLTNGPSALCVQNTCICDDETTARDLDLDVLALDDAFAYGASSGQLVRAGLRDARRDVLADVSPQAVAVNAGCVYVASADRVIRVALPDGP